MTNLQNLERRSRMLRAIREWFYAHDFCEVETPVRIKAPAPEEFIEAVRADNGFLRTSPELEMKTLLANGMSRIFQIGSCFRSGEFGRKHREEFTMLEFYEAATGYREQAAFTAEMIASTARTLDGDTKIVYRGHSIDLGSHEFITVDEAFRKYAGISAFEADESDDFDEIMVTRVEPKLGLEHPTFLCDYPASRASLARLSPDNSKVAERWEVYIAGIELGNAFGELTDPAEQRKRFRDASAFRRRMRMHNYPEPVAFFDALDRGLPQSSGCAIGLDRLAMIFCDAEDIAEVRCC
ncbi:MAG: EF-P lysine aminoacylase EpmA [Victivallaceae bacterium]|nr:EF-P lysine aminoacylase EpmA [Victivallaceae bacterium]